MKTKKILLLIHLVIITAANAQNQVVEIRLLDFESGLPVVNVSFEYGDQNGLSDAQGWIRFTLVDGRRMQLSHLNYGRWDFTDAEIREISRDKIYYCIEQAINLYPITIIGVKPQRTQPGEAHIINYQDHLSHDAAEILNQFAAFNSIRKGAKYGFDPVFRGFKYEQLNVVLNGGQSAIAACPNRMDPPTSQLAPNMIDKVEVLKGPHALRYGVGLGATINFIPSNLRFTNNPITYGRLSSAYESNGGILRGESHVGFSGQKHDVGFFASWSGGGDYKAGNGETVPSNFRRGSYGSNVGVKLAANQQLRLSATYNRARNTAFPALPMDLIEDDTWLFSARHEIHFSDRTLRSWNTTFFGSFVDHLMNNSMKVLNPRTINAETFASTFSYGGRTEAIWSTENSRFFAGADLRMEGAKGTRVREFLTGPNAGKIFYDNAWQDGYINKTALFSEYQLKGKYINYIFSTRLELNKSDLIDPAPEFMQVYAETGIVQINPSISIGFLKGLGEKFQTGLWIARAQRSGSLAERFINYFPVGQDPYEILGNPKLKPEKNYQADLSFKRVMNQGSEIQMDLFLAYLLDFISANIDTTLTKRLPASPGVRRVQNIEKAMKTGFDAIWIQQLSPVLMHRLSIAYTYGQNLKIKEPLPEIAPLDMRYVLVGVFVKGRLRPEISFRYVVEQSRVFKEFGETVTPAFNLLDVKIGYKFNRGISLSFGVDNLLDESYYEHLNRSVVGSLNPIFAPGRSVFISMNYSF